MNHVQCSVALSRRRAAACGSSGWTRRPARRRWAVGRRPTSGASRASTISGEERPSTAHTVRCSVLFCSLAFLDPRVGHTMDVHVLSPVISILCHSDWLFHRESCPRLDVVYPGLVRSWSQTGSNPNSITLSGSKLVADQLRTSFEPASVMEFGFTQSHTARS